MPRVPLQMLGTKLLTFAFAEVETTPCARLVPKT